MNPDIEILLKEWNPAKDTELFKRKLWHKLQDTMRQEKDDSIDLEEDDLNWVVGGVKLKEIEEKDLNQ